MTNEKWMAELSGSLNDLECLQRWYTSESVRVFPHEGTWLLGGTFLQGYSSADEVTKVAEAKLELLSAAALIESSSEPLKVEVIGAAHQNASGKLTIHYTIISTSRSCVSVRCLGSETPSLPQRALVVAESDYHLDMALRLWGDSSKTWPRLYRIVEDICESLKSNKEDNKDDIQILDYFGLGDQVDNYRRFRYSACEAGVAGKDSRHAEGRNNPPKKVAMLENPIMHHREAVSLVGLILFKAIQKKWKEMEESAAPAADIE